MFLMKVMAAGEEPARRYGAFLRAGARWTLGLTLRNPAGANAYTHTHTHIRAMPVRIDESMPRPGRHDLAARLSIALPDLYHTTACAALPYWSIAAKMGQRTTTRAAMRITLQIALAPPEVARGNVRCQGRCCNSAH